MTQEKLTICASPEDKGQRLDQFLTKKLGIARAQVVRLIKENEISALGGKPVKPSYSILGHEQYLANLAPKPSLLEPANIPLDILYSDAHIAVVNKPLGLVVHPGAGVKSKTLCHALLHHFPELLEASSDRPGIVHRLDRDTSGVMVVAKTAQALAKLSEDFKERKVKKVYRTLVWGEFSETHFELKTGHARHPFHRLRFFTKMPPPQVPSVHVRFAHTSFEIKKRGVGITEILATLHTGRTHQIRAHLADIDHPMLGDCLYGGKREPSRANQALRAAIESLKGQALHSERIEFNHPVSNERLSFSAPVPETMALISSHLA